mmetsp:Transcript_27513/g.53863  ORF Transcript_27513/g.53863 Transcript_27513/m.53863 type:complete len:101 (-) Transcript_27513:131-433(-)
MRSTPPRMEDILCCTAGCLSMVQLLTGHRDRNCLAQNFARDGDQQLKAIMKQRVPICTVLWVDDHQCLPISRLLTMLVDMVWCLPKPLQGLVPAKRRVRA